MRRDGSASAVFGRSSEMRAGLSMVKRAARGAAPDQMQRELQLLTGQGLHVDRLELQLQAGRAASAARQRSDGRERSQQGGAQPLRHLLRERAKADSSCSFARAP